MTSIDCPACQHYGIDEPHAPTCQTRGEDLRRVARENARRRRALDRAVCRRIATDPAYICATTEEDRRTREVEIEREECARLAQPGGAFA